MSVRRLGMEYTNTSGSLTFQRCVSSLNVLLFVDTKSCIRGRNVSKSSRGALPAGRINIASTLKETISLLNVWRSRMSMALYRRTYMHMLQCCYHTHHSKERMFIEDQKDTSWDFMAEQIIFMSNFNCFFFFFCTKMLACTFVSFLPLISPPWVAEL